MQSEHHQSRYAALLESDVFHFISILGTSNTMKLEYPELALKFDVVRWIAQQRAKPRSFTIPEMAKLFGLTREGMRKQLLHNPMIEIRPAPTRNHGHTVFIAPWVLDAAVKGKT